MDNFLELCRRRRSIRNYADRAVEKDKLDRILQCALMSPSGKRMNPWEFYVTDNRALIGRLQSCKQAGATMLKTAPVVVAVALDTSLIDTWQADGAIAAQNILLAAEDEGLGACWCHVYQRDEAEQVVHREMGIPAHLTVLCLISIGYKNEERRQYELEKLNYQKVHFVS